MKTKIVIVDDDRQSAELMQACLNAKGYDTVFTTNPGSAIGMISDLKPGLVLVDVMMPGVNGIDLCKEIKSKYGIPVIIMTGLSDREVRIEALTAGADDFINKPVEKLELQLRVGNILATKEYSDYLLTHANELENKVNERTKELQDALANIDKLHQDIINRLLRAAEFRDDETGKHILRVSKYSRLIAQELGWEGLKLDMLEQASPMHDVGKIGIPDNILLKPTKLLPEEFEIMKKHTIIGARILAGSSFPLIQMAQEIALTHHEKFDGSGYPQGLKGKEIPIVGRIAAIADVYDALISRRPYKPALENKKAVEIIKVSVGTHFDSHVAEAFFSVIDKIEEIKDKYSNDDEMKPEIALENIYTRG
ncbi:MAG: HD domain-containing phosphohydrolase [Elusimicrobiota bacterium]